MKLSRIAWLFLTLTLSIVSVLLVSQRASSQDITTNILQRVFLIKYGNKFCSSFTVEVQQRQYLITSRHSFIGIKSGESIQIFRNNKWDSLTVKIIDPQPRDIDIIVFVLPIQISPSFPIEPTIDGLVLAQDMYFLGFPFGLGMDGNVLNNGFPLPFVKKGICSAINYSASKGYTEIYVDGHNNPGFSGGPVVFVDKGSRSLRIAGVVSGYRNQDDKVFRRIVSKMGDKDAKIELAETDMIVQSNSGIVLGYSIKNAIDAISKNPIGPIVKE